MYTNWKGSYDKPRKKKETKNSNLWGMGSRIIIILTQEIDTRKGCGKFLLLCRRLGRQIK